MRRAGLALLLLLLLAPLSGGTGARLHAEGPSPVEDGAPMNPQLYCVVVYEAPGSQRCRVRADVRGVEMVRVRIAGLGAWAYVSVIDDLGPTGFPEQRALVTCTATCLVRIDGGPHTDHSWTMDVETSSSAGRAAIAVSLENRTHVADRLQF